MAWKWRKTKSPLSKFCYMKAITTEEEQEAANRSNGKKYDQNNRPWKRKSDVKTDWWRWQKTFSFCYKSAIIRCRLFFASRLTKRNISFTTTTSGKMTGMNGNGTDICSSFSEKRKRASERMSERERKYTEFFCLLALKVRTFQFNLVWNIAYARSFFVRLHQKHRG